MLIDRLNECISEMKTVHEMETVFADTKKQATANYNFKQVVINLEKIVYEVNLAVENSEFRPSDTVITELKRFLVSCDEFVQVGVADNATTKYISSESEKLYAAIKNEWTDYYSKATVNIFSLLETLKTLIPDESKAIHATNKIKKAFSWNTSIDNYNYLKKGLAEADEILEDLDLNENSEILAFFKLVSEGKATLRDLTDEVLTWVKAEKLEQRIKISFVQDVSR